jgi:site-specific recombinase XerD
LLVLLGVLRDLGVVGEEPVAELSESEMLLASFAGYLRSERGLAEGTIKGYARHARVFLGGLGDHGLAAIAAGDVTAALAERAAAGWSVSATRFFVSGLRAFLRFCFAEGLVAVDLSPAALYASGRAPSPLPKAVTRGQARALLGSCDRRRALGRRDYALIVLLLRLGLRCGEVARLCLGDVDWRAGEIVVRGKAARMDRLPLPVDVGEALAGYLQRGRPVSERREVFLRAKAPFSPIAAKTVSSTVRRACQRAGLAVVGAHRLRHTAACEMVAAGVPLTAVGQVLRHRSLQTTAIYARVDLEQLRGLAVAWPGSDLS